MKPLYQINKRYRQIPIASLIFSGSLLLLQPAFADPLLSTAPQNSAAPGKIENQATAEFTDSADDSIGKIVSDIVKVDVAEIAGISATAVGVNSAVAGTAPTLYPTSTAYFDFVVKNEGNDPTQLFIPAAPSVATVNGSTTGVIVGQLQIINYNTITPGTGTAAIAATANSPAIAAIPAVINTTPVTTGNLVNTSTGSATGSLTGIPNGGSVPAGGYVTVRVPITIPFGTPNNAPIVVTLGNTPTAPTVAAPVNNMPYMASGIVTPGNNDLLTQDNTTINATTGESNTPAPFNGEREASATQTVNAIVPKVVISGKVYDDANNSAAGTFSNIPAVNSGDPAEVGADTTAATPPLRAILVKGGNIVANVPVLADGTYTFADIDGFQNGLSVILSTSTLTTGTAPTTSVPTGWIETSPLTYTPTFDVTDNRTAAIIASYTGKDFGIERLPETVAVNTGSQANPTGVVASTIKYQVPTLSGSDPEDTTVTKFKIVTLPLAAQGILYYNGTAVTVGQEITDYDATLLKFDPVDGPVAMSFTYASIDKAGKVDPTPANATMTFSAGNVTITGTVFNDKDKSAITDTNPKTGLITFTDIKPNISGVDDSGTSTLFGTNGTPIYAILVNSSGNIIASQLIPSTGIYSFSGVAANTDVKVILSTIGPGTPGNQAPAAGLPGGWLGTTAQDSGTFNTGLYGTDVAAGGFEPKDFGVIQKAKLVIVKRITKIGKTANTMSTTNPNDNTSLAGITTDSFNFNATNNPTVPSSYVGNWPANYIVGATDAGKVVPGDFIEYTIYFLNNQGADAKNVKTCDRIRGSQNYVDGTITLNLTNNPATVGTPIADTASRVNVFTSNAVPTNCNVGAATSTGTDNGGVAIDITTIGTGTATADQPVGIPGAVNPANPSTTTNSYGMFRFRTQVKP